MRRPSDYMDEMFNATISDREIESVLSGRPVENSDLTEVAEFVEVLRAYERTALSEDAVLRFAASAAAEVPATQPLTAAPSRGRLARRHLGLRPQVAAMLTTILLVAASTGVAVAADAAAPGDGLYRIDRALEKIGIGDGEAGERLEEANELLAEGRAHEALGHVTEALDATDDDVAQARSAVDTAIQDLETAEAEAGDRPDIEEDVTALLAYLSENIGKGVGLDGREFGQGVAELARGITSDDEPTEITDPLDDPEPGDGSQPEDQNGIDEGPGNGNGSSDAPGIDSGNGIGTENGNINPPEHGNENGQGNRNGQGSGNTNPPGNENGHGQGDGNADPPGNGNGNSNGGDQGTRPPPESPSATAPGQAKKP